MPRVGLITDSTACLPGELVQRYGIRIVPVALVLEGRVYRDGLDLPVEDFYRFLEQSKKLPTTSPASPGDYLEVYRELGEKVESILCLTVSAKVSAMFDSARAARETAAEVMPQVAIEVIDSGTAAMAQGFVVLAAARASARGGDLKDVVAAAHRVMPRVHLVAFLDTLYYLARGGRIPKAAAWAGSLLRVKPIIQMAQGEVSLLERARTNLRAQQRLLDIMRQRVGGEPLHVAVFHANVLEEAERLREQVASQFPCAELYVTQFTPVMGAHSGPGLLGLAFYSGE